MEESKSESQEKVMVGDGGEDSDDELLRNSEDATKEDNGEYRY